MLIILILFNHFLLEEFFLQSNEKTIVKVVEQTLKEENQEKGYDYFRVTSRIHKSTGSETIILNSELDIILGERPIEDINQGLMSSADDFMEILRATVANNIEQLQLSETKSVYEIVGGDDSRDRQIQYIKLLENGDYLVLTKGLGLVKEAKYLFTVFLLFASAIVYLIGIIIIYLYAKHFTKPIVQIQKAAEGISKLEFNEPINVYSKDEVGSLVVSINKMAATLSENIDALNQSNFQLEQELSKERNLDVMRQRFVSDVSHELKNPISMIIGYADGIERGIPKTEEDKAYYAHVIHEEGKKMNRLVKDLLELSSFTSKTVSLELQEISLSELIHEVIERFESRLKEKKWTLILKYSVTCSLRQIECE